MTTARARHKKRIYADEAMSMAIRAQVPGFVASARELHPGLARKDAGVSLYFERELMQTLGRTYDYEYPELIGRSLCPVSHEMEPGATSLRYVQYNEIGRAAIIKDFSQDLPEVNVVGKEFFFAPRNLGDSYKYSIDELATAVVAARNGAPGPSLDQRRAMTARKVVELGIDDIIALGDADSGLLGMLNMPNTLTYTVAMGQTGSTQWSSKSPLEIYNDLNGISTAIVEFTNNVEVPDTIIVPIGPYQYLTQPMTLASDTTVLSYFLANSPYIKRVVQWYKAKGIGSGSTDRMMCYNNNPMKLAAQISREFAQEPPQARNLAWVINCHAKTFGVIAHYPKSIAFGDGI